jgi:hypothetical protein
MIKALAALLMVVASAMPVAAIDLKDLAPCKAAAVRLCDRSGGLNVAALWRCGAKLAARSGEVGHKCVAVLVRYGQLPASTSIAGN